MPSDNIAISVRNLTKSYRLFGHPGDRIKQFVTFGLKQYHREFTALKDVSFDIKKGETVGIIGRNGSGKSTLLQLICGILKPTTGTVHVNGRISALLELGAGFNPEFTGRENVYFQGALMGFTRARMDEKFDDIAAFADIGEFIDQPVRTYSSGMFVRLAFSVAAHIDPEVLILDEALGVGDIAFQRKCFHRLERFTAQGGTTLLVSHKLEDVRRQCVRALMLQHSELTLDGSPKIVTDAYEKALFSQKGDDLSSTTIDASYGTHEANIEESAIEHPVLGPATAIQPGETFDWTFTVHFRQACAAPVFSMLISTADGISMYGTETPLSSDSRCGAAAGERIRVSFRMRNVLLPGTYFINAGVKEYRAEGMVFLHRQISSGILRVVGSPLRRSAIGLADLSAAVTFQTR